MTPWRWVREKLREKPRRPCRPAQVELFTFVPVENVKARQLNIGPHFVNDDGRLFLVDDSGLIQVSLKFKPEELSLLRDALLQLDLPAAPL